MACYQPGPSACDMGACDEIYNPNGTHVFVYNIWVCCMDTDDGLDCYHHAVTEGGAVPQSQCAGFLAICDWGATNLDGTALELDEAPSLGDAQAELEDEEGDKLLAS